ncbi:uncharacterized protein LOC121061023 [Cygnus olor]|uniref:uncharacterized protein LOC121061023 n=1 Tax=Cygnus olor TaxID=8869 RepID=UPI001ADE4859|nr:uncharacterized protein LOC121061023 [Cygnus olor]
MLASTEPCTALAAAGMGRDGMGGEVRVTSVSPPGRAGPAPHSSGAGRASAWHGQRGRLWQQDGAVLPGWGPRAGGWSGLPAAGPHCRRWDQRWRCHQAGRAAMAGLPVPGARPRSWVRTEADLGHDAQALRCRWLGSGCAAVTAGHLPLAGTRSSPGVTVGREELGGCAGGWGAAGGAAATGLTPPPPSTGRVGSVCSLVSSNHFLSCVLAVFFFQRAGPLPQPTSGLPFGIGTPSRTSGACPFGDHQPGRTLTHSLHCRWQRGCAAPIPQPCHPSCPTVWAPGPPLLPAGFGQGDGWVGGRPATWVPFPPPKGRGAPLGRGAGARCAAWCCVHLPG